MEKNSSVLSRLFKIEDVDVPDVSSPGFASVVVVETAPEVVVPAAAATTTVLSVEVAPIAVVVPVDIVHEETPPTPSKAVVMDVKISSRESDMIGRLQAAGKSCLLESGADKNVLYARSNSVLDLLIAIEAVMKDGLTVKFWEAESVWSFVKHAKNLDSDAATILDKVEVCDLVVTDSGKFRCFVMFGLESKCCAKLFQVEEIFFVSFPFFFSFFNSCSKVAS